MLSPKLASLYPVALALFVEPMRRSPFLLPDTPQIVAGQSHTRDCRLGSHKLGVP